MELAPSLSESDETILQSSRNFSTSS